MKGYLIIPIWLLGFAGTTAMLVVAWLLSLVKKSSSKPYFKERSIFHDPANKTVQGGKKLVRRASLHRGWHRYISVLAPILGLPIGCLLAFGLFIKAQEWILQYQISPIVAFCGFNALGLIAICLGIYALDWARRKR